MTLVAPMRSPFHPNSTSAVGLIAIVQILDGHVEPLNVSGEVHFEPGPRVDGEYLNDRLYMALLVMGEEGELTDAIGLSWHLPHIIYDTPEMSEIWAKRCVEVMKPVVELSRPRQAIGDATAIMEVRLLPEEIFPHR